MGMEINTATQLFAHATQMLNPLIKSGLFLGPFGDSYDDSVDNIDRHQVVDNDDLPVGTCEQFGCYRTEI